MLLCDEPTGALDYQTGKKVLKILQDRSLKRNSIVIIVTYNAALAPIANKVIRIQDEKHSKLNSELISDGIINSLFFVLVVG